MKLISIILFLTFVSSFCLPSISYSSPKECEAMKWYFVNNFGSRLIGEFGEASPRKEIDALIDKYAPQLTQRLRQKRTCNIKFELQRKKYSEINDGTFLGITIYHINKDGRPPNVVIDIVSDEMQLCLGINNAVYFGRGKIPSSLVFPHKITKRKNLVDPLFTHKSLKFHMKCFDYNGVHNGRYTYN